MNEMREFFKLAGFYTEAKNPWKEKQHMTREEQLRAIQDLLNETRKQEYAEWDAAETGWSDVPSTENRQRAIILRVRIVEIIKVAKSIGFTQGELS